MSRRTARLLEPGDVIGLEVEEDIDAPLRPADEGNTVAVISSKQATYDENDEVTGYDFVTDVGLFHATPGQTFPLVGEE